eukprot:NODE_1998_length_1013_cov_150.847510_g1624_i0.p1 GENE.NODE_1998_length_1013_cov_150.847510_g1624_i0~~NODE_1998_length_1013_cov_150.847510_g1624_i0.p1  ORF type:complete len:275 (+),score=89.85 NODE_1998_length_1013_cov_150.847510_g1624_i0:26-826(+)
MGETLRADNTQMQATVTMLRATAGTTAMEHEHEVGLLRERMKDEGRRLTVELDRALRHSLGPSPTSTLLNASPGPGINSLALFEPGRESPPCSPAMGSYSPMSTSSPERGLQAPMTVEPMELLDDERRRCRELEERCERQTHEWSTFQSQWVEERRALLAAMEEKDQLRKETEARVHVLEEFGQRLQATVSELTRLKNPNQKISMFERTVQQNTKLKQENRSLQDQLRQHKKELLERGPIIQSRGKENVAPNPCNNPKWTALYTAD